MLLYFPLFDEGQLFLQEINFTIKLLDIDLILIIFFL